MAGPFARQWFRGREALVGQAIATGIRVATPAVQSWLSYRNLKWISGRGSEIYAAEETLRENNGEHASFAKTWTGRRGRASFLTGAGIRTIAVPARDAGTMPRRYYKKGRNNGGYGRRRNGYRKRRATRRQRKRTGGLMYLNSGPIGERRIGGKFVDFAIANQVISAIWTGSNLDPAAPVSCLSVALQGVGGRERMGRNMKIKHISVNGLISAVAKELGATPLARQVQVRIILFVDHNTNGAVPLAANVMETFGLPAAVLAHYNLEGVGRYTILSDKTITLVQTVMAEQSGATFAASSANKTFRCGFAFNPYLKVRFQIDNPAAALSAVIDNSIHIIAVHDSTGFEVEMTYNARLRFVDGNA